MTTRMSRTRQQSGPLPLERLSSPPDAADHHREAKTKQAGADNRAGDLRPHDVRLAVGQHERGEDQFGEAAEADIEQAAERRAYLDGHLLRRPPDPVREDPDRDRASHEHPDRRRAAEVTEPRGDRDREQQRERDRELPQHGAAARRRVARADEAMAWAFSGRSATRCERAWIVRRSCRPAWRPTWPPWPSATSAPARHPRVHARPAATQHSKLSSRGWPPRDAHPSILDPYSN